MTIQLDWGDYDQNFAIMTFQGKWTGDEFVHSIARLTTMGNEATSDIELMVDMRNSLTPPNNLLTLLRSTLNRPMPQHIKQVVVISNSAFWLRIFSMLSSMYGDKISAPVLFVASVDEAYAALECFKGLV
jgi:hypothetical protein